MGKVDLIGIIQDSADQYASRWQEIVMPFLALFAISVIVIVLSVVFSISADIVGLVAPLLSFPFRVASPALSVLEAFISTFITLAAIVPVSEFIAKQNPSDFTEYLPGQIINGILVIILRTVASIASFIPFAAAIAFNVAAAIALVSVFTGGRGLGPSAGLAAMGGFGSVLIVGALLSVILVLLVNLFLTFLEVELVLGRKGFTAAVGSSVSLVRDNLLDVFLFDVLWWLLGLGVGVVTTVMCCTIVLIPVAIILQPLVFTPVQLISTVSLWNELSGAGPAAGRAKEEPSQKPKARAGRKAK